MIYLVLSLTIITAYSFRAEAVFQAAVQGQDKIPGFRRVNDTTLLTVLADTDMVSLIGNPPLNLTCEPLNDQYLCTYSFPFSSQSPGLFSIPVQEESTPPKTTRVQYAVDGVAPYAEVFLPMQAGQRLSATYTVVDTASPAPDCSGLATVQFVANEQVIATQNESGCRSQGVLAGAAPGLSGPIELYLIMTDRLGNTGTSKKVVRTIDTIAPGLPSSYRLLRNGQEITAYSTEAASRVVATLAFHITEQTLTTVSVNATSLDAGAESIDPTCVQNGTGYDCSVLLTLHPDAPSGDTSFPITITAQDGAGNVAHGIAYTTLHIENTKPVITYLGRPYQCSTCFARNGPTRVVAVVEAPGGMANKGLFFSIGRTTVQAENCTDEGNTWRCTADIPFRGAHGSEQRLLIIDRSMDDLGNLVTGTLEKRFVIDTKKPRITKQPSVDVACPVAGQALTVSFEAEDDSQKLFLTANTSSVTDRDETTTVCEKTDGFRCTLTVDGFLSTHTNGKVPIIITDEAGNEQRLLLSVEVCEAEGEVTPNYITRVAPAGNLPLIDKRIASLIPFKVMIPLKLSLVGQARVSQLRSVRCMTPQIVGPSYVMNEFTNAPLLVTSYYSNSVWPNGTVGLNCTLDFTMRRGNVVYLKPEMEQLNLTLPLTGQELGNPGQAIRDKERALVTDINKLQDRIKSKAAIDNSLGKICELAETIGSINAALQAVKALLYSIAVAIAGTGVGAAAGAALWKATHISLSGFQRIVNTYIWPVGWLPIGSSAGSSTDVGGAAANGLGVGIIGYLVKWLCGLYECKMYDAGTWASIGLEWATINGKLGLGVNEEDLPKGTANKEKFGLGKLSTETNNKDFGLGLDKLDFKKDAKEFNLDLKKQDTFFKWTANKDQPSFTDLIASNLQETQNLLTVLPGDGWIVNPYRSTRYDGMCIPAQLYNARKEKQLKCIELECIREMATTGMPVTQCEEKFSAQSCLYLESAQAREHGAMGNFLTKFLGAIGLQLVLGYGVQKGFKILCNSIYSELDIDPLLRMSAGSCASPSTTGSFSLQGGLPCGVKAVACGLTGAAFNLQELLGFAHGLRSQNPSVPNGPDYCEGLDGVEPDDTASSGGGFL